MGSVYYTASKIHSIGNSLNYLSMEEGTVKFYNPSRGFGFIKRNEGADLFIQKSEVDKMGIRTIVEGQKINFEVQTDDGKLSGVNLKLIK